MVLGFPKAELHRSAHAELEGRERRERKLGPSDFGYLSMNSNITFIALFFSTRVWVFFLSPCFSQYGTDLMEDARWKVPLGLGVERGLVGEL